jgi:nitrate reductase NapE component
MESTNTMDSRPPMPPSYKGQSDVNTTSDMLIFIVIAYMLFHTLAVFLIGAISDVWWNHSVMRYIYTALGIIGAASPLVLGFAIRNKILKIIGIIIGALYTIYAVIRSIIQLITFIRHF